MERKAALRLLSAVLFGGCTLIPHYERPDAPVRAEFPQGADYQGSQDGAKSLPAADLHWRTFFSDRNLQQIIETALQNNRDLRAAALNVERARALYRIQRAELLPTAQAGASYIKQRQSGELVGEEGPREVEQYNARVGTFSWEIDFFGRIQSQSEAALQEFFATEQGRRSAQILLVAEVANTYLLLAADRENLRLAQLTLESQQSAYRVIERRYQVGLAPELDLRQVQTRVDAARVDMARFTELAARDKNAIDLLAGAPVPQELLPAALSDVQPPVDVSPGLSSAVLLERPDVLQAENRLKAANANIGAARAALFPSIRLTSTVGTASTELSGLFQSGTGVWTFAPQVDMPIFDARSWIALNVTEVEREIAKTQYEGSIQSAFRDVADALAQKANLVEQLAAQESLVNSTAEAYRLSNARYDKGVDIFLNVLDAQRSLYGAQQGLIAIRLAKLANQVRLYSALGGGAQPRYLPPTAQ